jgi:hypothetical protein
LVYVSPMSTPTRPIPVRLDERTRIRLRKAATRMGSSTSAVIRFALYQQLTEIESGTIRLTPEPQKAS